MSGRLFLFAATATSVAVASVIPAAAAPASQSSWAAQANKVCVVFLAKAKKAFGSPVTTAQLYRFAAAEVRVRRRRRESVRLSR